jgi:hypothetical protein
MVIAATPDPPAAFGVGDELQLTDGQIVRRPVSNATIFTTGPATSWACIFARSREK